MINIGQLKRLAKGKTKAEDLPPFIIARDKVRMKFNLTSGSDQVAWEYAVIYGNKADYLGLKQEVIIDRPLALALIRRCGMSRVVETEDCQLYEQPGQPFLEKFQHQGLNFTEKKCYKKIA